MGNAKTYNLAVRRAWREVRQGRRVIVAPATLITPDSPLCGSQGCLKYPINELTKSFKAWHDIPITLWHPSGGAHSSGSDPDVWERQGIGRLERPTANGKLRAFTVFDEERTRNADRRHGTDVLRRLENLIAGHGEPLELSTGLHTRNVPQTGMLNGRHYNALATDHGPDHLAVLPGQRGACSVADGCGVGVVNAMRSGGKDCGDGKWGKGKAPVGVLSNANPEGHNQYSAAAAHADSKTDAAESRSEDAHDYAKGKDDLADSALDHAKVLADNDDHVGAAKTLAAAGKQVADAVKEHVAARDAHVEAAGAHRDAGKLVKGADADKLDSDKATTRESHRDTAEDHKAKAREHHEAAQELKGKFNELKEAHDAVKDEAKAVSTQDRASAATVKAHAATDEARAGDSAEKHYVAAQLNDKAAASHRAHAETRSGLGKRYADEMAEGHDKLAASHRAAAKLAKNQSRNGGPGSGRRPSGHVRVREAGHIADAASAKAGRTGTQADHLQARITHEDAGRTALAHDDLDIAKSHYQQAAFHASQAEARRPAGGTGGGHFATLPRPASVAEKRIKGSASLWGYSGAPAATAKPAAAATKPAAARTAMTGRTTNMTNNCRCGGKCKRCKLAALNADDSDIELTVNANPEGHNQYSAGGAVAHELSQHITSEKLHDPSGFRNKWRDLGDADRKAAHAELKSRGLLHPIDARRKSPEKMTASEVIDSVGGAYAKAKLDHEMVPTNRHEPFKDSDTFKKMQGKTTNAAPGQGRHESGRYLPHGAGQGKGAVHQAAVQGANMGTCNCNMGVYNSAGRCLNCGKPVGTRNGPLGPEDMDTNNAGPGKPGPNQTAPQGGGGNNPLGPEDQGYVPGEAEPDQEAQMAQKLAALGIKNQADFAALTPAMRELAVNALLENSPAIVTDPDAAGKGVQTGPRKSHDGRDVDLVEGDDPEDFLAADDAGHGWQFPEEPSDLDDAPAEDVAKKGGQVKNEWSDAAREASAAARKASGTAHDASKQASPRSSKPGKAGGPAGVKEQGADTQAEHKAAAAAHANTAKLHDSLAKDHEDVEEGSGDLHRAAADAHRQAASAHASAAELKTVKNQRTKNQRASGRGTHNQRRNSMSKFTKLPPMSRRQMLSALTENCEDPERAAAYMALGNVELAAILTANAARNAKGDDGEDDEGDDDSSMEEGSSRQERNARNAGGNFAGVSDDSSLQAAEDSKIADAGTYGKAGKDKKGGQSTANESQQVAAWLQHVKAPAAITRAWNAMVANDQKQRVAMIGEIVANSRHAGSKRASRAYAAQLAQLAPEALQAVYDGMPRGSVQNGSGLQMPAFLNPGSLYVGNSPPAWNGAGQGDPLTANGSVVDLEDDDPKVLNEERKARIEQALHKNVSPGLAAAIRNGQVGAPEL